MVFNESFLCSFYYYETATAPKKRQQAGGLDAEKLEIPQRHFLLLFWVIFKPLRDSEFSI